MIARLWHGKVPSQKAAAYHQYLSQTGLTDYAAVQGNCGIVLMKREENGITHFYTLSFWQDREVLKAFAGEDIELARYYPEDKEYLLELEPLVTHFDVLQSIFNPPASMPADHIR